MSPKFFERLIFVLSIIVLAVFVKIALTEKAPSSQKEDLTLSHSLEAEATPKTVVSTTATENINQPLPSVVPAHDVDLDLETATEVFSQAVKDNPDALSAKDLRLVTQLITNLKLEVEAEKQAAQ